MRVWVTTIANLIRHTDRTYEIAIGWGDTNVGDIISDLHFGAFVGATHGSFWDLVVTGSFARTRSANGQQDTCLFGSKIKIPLGFVPDTITHEIIGGVVHLQLQTMSVIDQT